MAYCEIACVDAELEGLYRLVSRGTILASHPAAARAKILRIMKVGYRLQTGSRAWELISGKVMADAYRGYKALSRHWQRFLSLSRRLVGAIIRLAAGEGGLCTRAVHC